MTTAGDQTKPEERLALDVPHPIPYQGSKRHLAKAILKYFPSGIGTLHEPFVGSAAISLAAAVVGAARKFRLNDLNGPLMALWERIINEPDDIANAYENLWNLQLPDPAAFYLKTRDEFNLSHCPEHFLYLLARAVKAAVRYNSDGGFNQSADHRRKGCLPGTMRRQIKAASFILKGRATCSSMDYREALKTALPEDLVYFDPPYQGTLSGASQRYSNKISVGEFIETLSDLNRRGCSYIVSFDGRTGDKTFGPPLPKSLELLRLELNAGASSQATLSGISATTFESLYLSPALLTRLDIARNVLLHRSVDSVHEQLILCEAKHEFGSETRATNAGVQSSRRVRRKVQKGRSQTSENGDRPHP